MLFWICVILLAIGIACLVHYNGECCIGESWEILGIIFTTIGAFTLVIAIIFLCAGQIGVNGKIAENQQRYETLTYQYENNMYDNDNEIGKKELMNQIQEWNEDLAWYRANQKDFWIGIFIPNVFDQFEFINLKEGADHG